MGWLVVRLSFSGTVPFVLSEDGQTRKENSVDHSQKEESAVVQVAEKASPSVVSIIVSKDLPKIETYYYNPFWDDFFNPFGEGSLFNFQVPQYRQDGTEKREIGGGTGFIVSENGYILTNKHVVLDKDAEYTVLMNDKEEYEAEVLARDEANDLAVLKIEGDNFSFVDLGDSAKLKVGQTVIAIGNALGEFSNTVSVGVISGLSRSIVAGGAGMETEYLTGVIQTDAAINQGNSGGPLLNLAGQVIGINTAMAQEAQSIGFALPINEAKYVIQSVREHGHILRPWLGVRYQILTAEIIEKNKLSVNHGALITRGAVITDSAVIPGSPADKAGITEGDIILAVNEREINEEYSLAEAIRKFQPGDVITIELLRDGEKKMIEVTLREVES